MGVELNVHVDNTKAQTFYTQLGFKVKEPVNPKDIVLTMFGML